MDDLTRYLPGWLEATPAIAGILGRALYHFDQVRRGRRPAVGVLLACELAIALPMGYVGKGVVSYAGLTGDAAFAGTIVIAYLGPRVIEIMVGRWLDRRLPPPPAPPSPPVPPAQS